MKQMIVNRVCVGLAACALSMAALAQSTPAKPATLKSSAAPAAKGAKKSGPATVRRPPPPPAAALPVPILTRVQVGCLDEAVLQSLSLPVDATLPGLEQVSVKAPEWGPPAPCLVYSAAVTGQVSTLLVAQPDRGSDIPEMLVVTSEPGRELIIARREALPAEPAAQREVRLAARELDAALAT